MPSVHRHAQESERHCACLGRSQHGCPERWPASHVTSDEVSFLNFKCVLSFPQVCFFLGALRCPVGLRLWIFFGGASFLPHLVHSGRSPKSREVDTRKWGTVEFAKGNILFIKSNSFPYNWGVKMATTTTIIIIIPRNLLLLRSFSRLLILVL